MSDLDACKRWSRRKSERPAELTAAALDLFVERGYAATRLEDVARRAGVSKGTLYLYFDSKETLFKTVVRDGIVSALECGERLTAAHQGSARELLSALLTGWWELIGSRRIGGIPKLMLAECGNFPELCSFYLDEVVARSHRLIAAALQRGIDTGEFRDMDIDLVARLVWAPEALLNLWQYSYDQCERAPVEAQRYICQHLDLLFGGLLAQPDALRSEVRGPAVAPASVPSRTSRSSIPHGKSALHRE